MLIGQSRQRLKLFFLATDNAPPPLCAAWMYTHCVSGCGYRHSLHSSLSLGARGQITQMFSSALTAEGSVVILQWPLNSGLSVSIPECVLPSHPFEHTSLNTTTRSASVMFGTIFPAFWGITDEWSLYVLTLDSAMDGYTSHCETTATVKLMNTFLTWPGCVCGHWDPVRSTLSELQLSSTALLTIVAMLCIRPAKRTHIPSAMCTLLPGSCWLTTIHCKSNLYKVHAYIGQYNSGFSVHKKWDHWNRHASERGQFTRGTIL